MVTDMTLSEWAFVVCSVGWLVGVGLLADAFPRWLEDGDVPDAIRIALSMFPENVGVLMAIVIVSWPVSIPCLIVMQAKGEKK
jgi:hypothetical protein